MGRISQAVAHVLGIVMDTRDRNRYPVRGVDTVGPPSRIRRFEDYMENETFLQSLPWVIREKLEYLYTKTSIKEGVRTRKKKKHSG